MAEIDLKTLTPDTSLPSTGFLFGADSQSAAAPSVYSTQAVATALLGSTSLTGATGLTTSQPVLDLSQTWNASGVTFTGLRFNAATGSNTNSAAGSLLMDLQLEGTSQFRVRKDGEVIPSGSVLKVSNNIGLTGSNASLHNRSPNLTLGDSSDQYAVSISGAANTGITLKSVGVLRWTDGTSFSGTADLFLSRRAAANLRLGAADAASPVAQTLSVQSVVAGTTNTAGANLTITGSQGTGTGAGGSIVFQVAPAGSSGTAQNALVSTWQITGAGHLTLATDNTYDIGASGGSRPRDIYAATAVRAPIWVFTSPTGTQGTFRSEADGVLRLTNSGINDFGRLQFGGTTSSFPALKRSSTTLQARLADDSAFASVQGKLTTDTAYAAGDPTTTGYLVVYDSTGTAYKIPAVAA